MNYIAKRTVSNKTMNVFRVIACVIVFLGAQLDFGLVWDLTDVIMGVMAIINLPVIVILGKTALDCLEDYITQRKKGENPVFRAKNIGLNADLDFWQ